MRRITTSRHKPSRAHNWVPGNEHLAQSRKGHRQDAKVWTTEPTHAHPNIHKSIYIYIYIAHDLQRPQTKSRTLLLVSHGGAMDGLYCAAFLCTFPLNSITACLTFTAFALAKGGPYLRAAITAYACWTFLDPSPEKGGYQLLAWGWPHNGPTGSAQFPEMPAVWVFQAIMPVKQAANPPWGRFSDQPETSAERTLADGLAQTPGPKHQDACICTTNVRHND